MAGCCCSQDSVVKRIFSSKINGIVYNLSRRPVQYHVYGGYDQKVVTKAASSPADGGNSASVGGTFGGTVGGFKMPDVKLTGNIGEKNQNVNRNWEVRHVYEPGQVTVLPGNFSTMFLNELEPGKFKFSWRFKDEEWKAKDGIVFTNNDVCIKIREDETVKHMGAREVDLLKDRNQRITEHYEARGRRAGKKELNP